MDPDATLKDLLAAVVIRDEQQVSILAEGLQNWLNNGGFPPKTIGPWKLGQDWRSALTRCVCELAGVHMHLVRVAQEGRADVPL